ncbi:MAG: ParA family protein [Myxococcales bacterium]|nr:MAG: ParA family protein [Myxococcales bacterium]
MRVVSFINEKGGTCKTTFAVNIAAYYALKRKKKVLLIDVDSQGHAGKSLGFPVREIERTAYDLLMRKGDPMAAVLHSRIENLDIVCANKRLADFPEAAARFADRELRLLRALEALAPRGYDYAIIDSPPSAGLATTNILAASTDVVVPVALTYLAMDGCAEVVNSIARVRDRIREARPTLAMVIPTLYRPTKLANEIVATLATYFPDKISKTVMGFNVKIDEAQSHGQTIWEYEPEGKGALALEALAVELYNKALRAA